VPSLPKTSASLLAAILIACILAPAPAVAGEDDDKMRAIERFQTGMALLKVEDYAGAAVEFEASIELFESKNALFNLANCYQALHRYGAALEAFERLEARFGDEMPEGMVEAVARHREEIERVVGWLRIEVDHDGATVSIDGEPVGTSPLTRALVLGPREYRVEIALDGYERAARDVRLQAGDHHSEIITLKKAVASVALSVNVDGASVEVDGTPAGRTPLGDPLALSEGRHEIRVTMEGYEESTTSVDLEAGERLSVDVVLGEKAREIPVVVPEENRPSGIFWTGAGFTVATGIAAGVFWGLAGSRADDFQAYNARVDDHNDGSDPLTAEEQVTLVSDRDEAKDECKTFSNLAVGFGVAAGVLASTSAMILVLDLTHSEEEPSGANAAEVSITPGGLEVTF